MKQLKRISIIWGLLVFMIFSVLTFFALQWKSTKQPYFNLENNLVEATKKYYEAEHSYPNQGEKIKITFEELKEKNLLTELKINEEECNGYTLVENNGVIEYKGYIKCSDYTTKNYEN